MEIGKELMNIENWRRRGERMREKCCREVETIELCLEETEIVC